MQKRYHVKKGDFLYERTEQDFNDSGKPLIVVDRELTQEEVENEDIKVQREEEGKRKAKSLLARILF